MAEVPTSFNGLGRLLETGILGVILCCVRSRKLIALSHFMRLSTYPCINVKYRHTAVDPALQGCSAELKYSIAKYMQENLWVQAREQWLNADVGRGPRPVLMQILPKSHGCSEYAKNSTLISWDARS